MHRVHPGQGRQAVGAEAGACPGVGSGLCARHCHLQRHRRHGDVRGQRPATLRVLPNGDIASQEVAAERQLHVVAAAGRAEEDLLLPRVQAVEPQLICLGARCGGGRQAETEVGVELDSAVAAHDVDEPRLLEEAEARDAISGLRRVGARHVGAMPHPLETLAFHRQRHGNGARTSTDARADDARALGVARGHGEFRASDAGLEDVFRRCGHGDVGYWAGEIHQALHGEASCRRLVDADVLRVVVLVIHILQGRRAEVVQHDQHVLPLHPGAVHLPDIHGLVHGGELQRPRKSKGLRDHDVRLVLRRGQGGALPIDRMVQAAHAMLQGQADAVGMHGLRATELGAHVHAPLPRRAEVRWGAVERVAVAVAAARDSSAAAAIYTPLRGAHRPLRAEAALRRLGAAALGADLVRAATPLHAEVALPALVVRRATVKRRASVVYGVRGDATEVAHLASALPRCGARLAIPPRLLLLRQRLVVRLALTAGHAVLVAVAVNMVVTSGLERARSVDAIICELAVPQGLTDAAAAGGARRARPSGGHIRGQPVLELLALAAALAVQIRAAVTVSGTAQHRRASAINRVAAVLAPRDVLAEAAFACGARLAVVLAHAFAFAGVTTEAILVVTAICMRTTPRQVRWAPAIDGVLRHMAI
mmetsp:Transcript_41573/g.120000  ORF Transcript_41573/g.120000 Transcript_41573/m.120000 type:complete len:650 (-) Transcript_41573:691-2640(-)